MTLLPPRTRRHRFGFAPWGHRRWWHAFEPRSEFADYARGLVLVVIACAAWALWRASS